jgi:poly(A) polymerase
VILPDAPWRHAPGLARIIAALDGQARYVGGAVRDTLIGQPVTDVDLATPWLPRRVVEALETAGIRAIPTGIAHGTVTAIASDESVEITTLRKDVATDGRRATVAFSEIWAEDAARRDFTFNALYADPASGAIHDYFGGIDDLNARRVRFIGIADERIAEDHLRILRYFRFAARFGQMVPGDTDYAACVAAAPRLKALSRERIADELLKLLALPDPVAAVGAMLDGGIFAQIIAGVDPEAKALLGRIVAREAAHGVAPAAVRRLVALLPKEAKLAEKIAASLKLSNRLRGEITARIAPSDGIPAKAAIADGGSDILPHVPAQGGAHDAPPSSGASEETGPLLSQGNAGGESEMPPSPPTAATIRALAYWQGTAAARDRLLLYGEEAAIAPALAMLAGWDVPRFPLKGGDLIAAGLTAGPEVAKRLKELERQWVAAGFRLNGGPN